MQEESGPRPGTPCGPLGVPLAGPSQAAWVDFSSLSNPTPFFASVFQGTASSSNPQIPANVLVLVSSITFPGSLSRNIFTGEKVPSSEDIY